MSYAVTPTLSVEAPQLKVRRSSPMSEQLGWPGRDGASRSTGAPTASLSRLGPPLAVVAVALTVLLPAFSWPLTVWVVQVVQAPVPGNDWLAATEVPLTVMFIGRSTVVPLAYRNSSEAGPVTAEFTVNSTYDPVTLV